MVARLQGATMTEQWSGANTAPSERPEMKPLVSVADVARQSRQSRSPFPVYDVPVDRLHALDVHASRRVENGANGNASNHLQGLLGEDVFARHLGIAERLDTELYPDGDDGVDLVYRGATIDVKTVGRHRDNPALTVDAYEPLRADFYALAHRIGPNTCRLVGYAPRHFVANEEPLHGEDGPYHRIPREYLFPFVPR